MIKKKKTVLLTLLLSGCILCGCTQSSASIMKDEANSSLDSTEQEQPYSMAVPDDVTGQSETISANEMNASPGISQLNTQIFNGEEANLWYGNDNKLIVNKQTTLYLYDVKTGEAVAKTDTEIKEITSVYPYDNGYCIIGYAKDSTADKDKMLCIFYDEMLCESNQILLNGMLEDVLFTEFAVSADGSHIAYYDFWKGLNVYDVETGKTKQLMNVDASLEDRKNILTMDALYFEEDGSGLVFSAQTDNNNMTYESWGRINIDGSGLENYILDKGLGNAITYQNGRLIFGEDSLTFCGAMGYVNVKKQAQIYSTDIPCGSNVGGPKISQNGEYFAVTQSQNKSVQISIYRTEDFSVIYQQTIADDNEEYFYRIPKIYLFDEWKAGIICLGGHNDIPLKTVLIDYNK